MPYSSAPSPPPISLQAIHRDSALKTTAMSEELDLRRSYAIPPHPGVRTAPHWLNVAYLPHLKNPGKLWHMAQIFPSGRGCISVGRFLSNDYKQTEDSGGWGL